MSGAGETPPTVGLQSLLGDAAEAPDLAVTGLALSSRDVAAGHVFLAVRGTRMHGLAYAAEAVDQGASCIVYEPGEGVVSPDLAVPAVAVPELGRKVGEIAARYYGQPSKDLDVTAITGTDGKTSVAWIMASALNALGHAAHYIGTLGVGCPEGLAATSHTTPDPISLQKALAAARDDGARAVVMEVSSHALDQSRLAGTRVRCAVLTNLGRDHLDYHGDVASYHAAKRRLFTEMAPELRVLNADDRIARQWLKDFPDAWTCALDHPARVRVEEAEFLPQGVRFRLQADGASAEVRAPLLGRFNILNLCLVTGALVAQGSELREVARALSKSAVVPGRMQAVAAPGKPLVIVDYAHTPQALGQALLACKAHSRGRLWCVFGCGGERDAGKRPLMGQTAAAVADEIIITDDNPRSEDATAITQAILEGVGARAQVQVIHKRADAIAHAIDAAREGDIILIAGKGHEDTQQYGAVSYPFSDVACARELLGLEGQP